MVNTIERTLHDNVLTKIPKKFNFKDIPSGELENILQKKISDPNIDWYYKKISGKKISKIRETDLLSKGDEKALFVQYQWWKSEYSKDNSELNTKNILSIRDKITKYNIALIVQLSEKFYPFVHKSIEIKDLMSEGNKILLDCIECFDPNSNFKFSTYVSNSVWNGFSKFSKKNNKKIARTKEFKSLDDAVHLSKKEESYIEEIDIIKDVVETNLASLTNHQKAIIDNRFFSDKKKSYSELCKVLNVSMSEVRKIEIQALNKIKDAFISYGNKNDSPKTNDIKIIDNDQQCDVQWLNNSPHKKGWINMDSTETTVVAETTEVKATEAKAPVVKVQKFVIYQDNEGNEIGRKPKGKGRNHILGKLDEAGNLIVAGSSIVDGVISTPKPAVIAPKVEYITLDQNGAELSRTIKGRGKTKAGFAKHESGQYAGNWVKVQEPEAPATTEVAAEAPATTEVAAEVIATA